DRCELGGEDLLAVQQDVDAVASDHGSPRVSAERGRERGLLRFEMRQLEMRRHARAADDDDEQDRQAAADVGIRSGSSANACSLQSGGESKRDTMGRTA